MTAMRLHGLDTLRGIAAIMVAAYHAELIVGGQRLFAHGYLAVDFFFALSGFVMARTYEGRFPSALAFGAMRMRRFAPVMACGSLFGFVALLAPAGLPMASFLALLSLLYIPWPRGDDGLFPGNPPQWSILFELVANVLHAAVLQRLGVRTVLALALACAVLLLAFAAAPDDPPFALFRTLMSYCLGIALYRLRRRLPRLPYLAAPLVLVGGVAAADLSPVLAWAFLFVAVPTSLISGLTGTRARPWLGALSFPLYAVHYPVLMLSRQFGLGSLAGLVAALGAAAAVTLLFERRALTQQQPAARPDGQRGGQPADDSLGQEA
ncbi:acyltransferase family protein [Novosphingobium aquiterrae]|uniref:Acyltransferase family protein n=1 Tax=Novosphingobium aquiterrae TaxID=624388 RepID=A0ABV6PPA5_9SPHN